MKLREYIPVFPVFQDVLYRDGDGDGESRGGVGARSEKAHARLCVH